MKRLAAYCRVSTDRQKEEETIGVQKGFIREWAEKNNAQIVEWYMDDGWSGELLARPELDRLRDDVRKELWEGVVFLDRDRLARKLSLQELIIDELRDKNIEVIFLNEPLAENPEGRIMQQIKGVFAEYERAKITERMRRGRIHKAKSGKIVGNEAPYGYTYVLKSGDQDGYYVINEAEAEIVRLIFHLVADKGYSMYRVVQELYALGIPPAKNKNEYWRKSVIERLLNRKDYIGIAHYNKATAVVPTHPQNIGGYKKIKKSSRRAKPKDEWIAIPVPAIISEELFEKAHKQLRDNFLYGKRNKTYSYFLSGKVYCGCGSKRVGDGVNGHYYYRCSQRIYKFPVATKCKFEGVNAEVLDEMVWTKLLKLLSNPEVIKGQITRYNNKQKRVNEVSGKGLVGLQKALEALKEEENRYTKAYGSELITFERYEALMKEVKSKKAVIEAEAKDVLVMEQEYLINIDDVEAVCKEIMEDLQDITEEKKRNYMRNLVKSIYVKERRTALVNGCIPLHTQAQNIQDEYKRRNNRTAKCREKYTL